MVPPTKGKPLILYLTSTDRSIGALLAQEVDGVERPVYYLSRIVKGPEGNYSALERHCLALVFTTQKLRHYFLAHELQVVTRSDPIKFLLSRPVLSGRFARWILLLAEYDIKPITPKAIKSQALADLLAQFPSGQCEPINENLPGEEALVIEEGEWSMAFDGSSTTNGGGAGIVLTSPGGTRYSLSFKLDFSCTNNEAEYEALVIGLRSALDMGITSLCIRGDSNLVLKQVDGTFAVKEPALANYREVVRKLMERIGHVRCEHTPRCSNRHADALATLASKVAMPGEKEELVILKRSQPCPSTELESEGEEGEDWRCEIKHHLNNPTSAIIAMVKNFVLIEGVLYFRSTDGVLSRCVKGSHAENTLELVHEITCGTEGPPLYRRVQRYGCYWPSMVKDAIELQRRCENCQVRPDPHEAFVLVAGDDWRTPLLNYLRGGSLPTDKKEASELVRKAARYMEEQGELFRKAYLGSKLKCIAAPDINEVLEEMHSGDCGEHQGAYRLYQLALRKGYYWPTMESDAAQFVRKCLRCQMHGNLIHTPAVELHSINAPWPFHTWAMDLIGTITPKSRGNQWILVATECFTKWVEAVPLGTATGGNVARFIKEYIICRFGIPRLIISDNGTPFINQAVRELTTRYNINHVKSSPYYPQGNGQAEATNKTILKCLTRMVHEEHIEWAVRLPYALWAYRTSVRSPTKASPFSLVYGCEAILPTELAVTTPRVNVTLSETEYGEARGMELEMLEERRDVAKGNIEQYKKRVARAYDKKVRPRTLVEGDLVLKAKTHVLRNLSAPKFTPKWEGPFIVQEVYDSGYVNLLDPVSGSLTGPLNMKWVKKYHA